MTLRSLLMGIGGGIIGALASRSLARSGGPTAPAIVGETATYEWRGFEIEYATRGDETAQDVVCLHDVGITSSGREFRGLVDELADTHHVIVPDLPGYGRSSRLRVQYSASLYQSFLRAFLSDRSTQPIVIAAGLTGSYALDAAAGVDTAGVGLIVPGAKGRPQYGAVSRIHRLSVVGPALHNFLTARPALWYRAINQEYYDPSLIEDGDIEYRWQLGHQAGARFAPAARIGGGLNPGSTIPELADLVTAPIGLVWGREATAPPLAAGRTLAREIEAPLAVVDYTRTKPHQEHPAETAEALAAAVSPLRL